MKKPNPARQARAKERMERSMKKQEEMLTISGLRRLIIRMQVGGIIFLLVGLLMPKISPFYAEKSWKTLIGVNLGLPQAVAIFGCIMIIVSVVCFFRSYRCAKCGGLLALTPYKKVTKCRSCGVKVTEKDIYRPRGE